MIFLKISTQELSSNCSNYSLWISTFYQELLKMFVERYVIFGVIVFFVSVKEGKNQDVDSILSQAITNI